MNREAIERIKENWSLEMDGVAMYASLARRDAVPERKKVFQALSELERAHAEKWAKRLRDLGEALPERPDGAGHEVHVEDGPGGMQSIILAVEEAERRDVDAYLHQLRDASDEATKEILRQVVLDEFAHAHTLRRLFAESSPRSALDYLRSRRRQGTGSWIGDAVYGVNDGLGAIFGIVSGVSGATLGNSKVVLLAGLAGMIASALSMGSGAYLAAKSEREIYEAELEHERKTLREHEAEAKEELAVFYRLKGVPDADASKMSEFLAANPDQFLRTMAAEKLNLTEDALSNPVSSAITGSISTAVGAIIPVVPFFFMSGYPAVIVAAIVSLVAHFIVGAAKSLVTVRSWWASGMEMTVVGAAEGVVTYLIGIGLAHIGAGG